MKNSLKRWFELIGLSLTVALVGCGVAEETVPPPDTSTATTDLNADPAPDAILADEPTPAEPSIETTTPAIDEPAPVELPVPEITPPTETAPDAIPPAETPTTDEPPAA